MTDWHDRDFKEEIKELKIQELMSKQVSYEEFTKNAVDEKDKKMTKEEYVKEVREICRLQVINDEFKAAIAQHNVDVYEKSSVLGLRKYIKGELREHRERQNVIKRLLEEILDKLDGK